MGQNSDWTCFDALFAALTENQRLVLVGKERDIASRRARTRAKNDLRALRLLYSEGDDLTPLGENVLRVHWVRADQPK